MSDSTPTPAEPSSKATDTLTKSFADRLTFPSDSKAKSNGTDPGAPSFTPSKLDWADEVATPVQEKASESKAAAENGEGESDLSMAQKDGATTWLGGSQGLDEPEFDVNVKLADLQEDPNNPLYSVSSFEDLNL